MTKSLPEIAREVTSHDPVSKPMRYYEIYERVLREESSLPEAILEIGVFKGESTRILATRFPDARIVALDVRLREIDFSAHANVRYLQCDQTNQGALKTICEEHLAGGIDLVIEDASHIGLYSRLTFDAVFPFVKSGGLYVVEDWGTGYWDDWADGSRFQAYPLRVTDKAVPKRLPSHDFGMVGFVKSLVDYSHETAIKTTQKAPPVRRSRIKRLSFFEGVCVACKS